MGSRNEAHILATLDGLVHPLDGTPAEYAPLLNWIGEARFVLLGEASHGTAQFYRERIRITQRLIVEKAFDAVAVEADWPDAYRVNRYVRGLPPDANADQALGGFQRFPAWMWRNQEVLQFVRWLRAHNDRLPPERRVGFYGLDLYSLHASIAAVLQYLHGVDPAAARRARERYGCLDHFGPHAPSYSALGRLDLDRECEEAVVGQLTELVSNLDRYVGDDGREARDDFFDAALNARVVRNAERYYRSMLRGRADSWNLRDRHMMEVLTSLAQHLNRPQRDARIAVWAHNSHLGDARATQMHEAGELNLGQLVREAHPDEAYLLGFTTYGGQVTAADDWDEPAREFEVRPALMGSCEALFHGLGLPRFLLELRDTLAARELLHEPRLQRAIGVIYRPQTERVSHYFHTRLPQQFDAVLHIDQTGALQPLRSAVVPGVGQEPETYPSAL